MISYVAIFVFLLFVLSTGLVIMYLYEYMHATADYEPYEIIQVKPKRKRRTKQEIERDNLAKNIIE